MSETVLRLIHISLSLTASGVLHYLNRRNIFTIYLITSLAAAIATNFVFFSFIMGGGVNRFNTVVVIVFTFYSFCIALIMGITLWVYRKRAAFKKG